jgi:hypothetical protein
LDTQINDEKLRLICNFYHTPLWNEIGKLTEIELPAVVAVEAKEKAAATAAPAGFTHAQIKRTAAHFN